MECKVSWNGPSGMSFRAETGSGHLVTMDGAPDGGGRNLAPRPMETLLAGAGATLACWARGWDLAGVTRDTLLAAYLLRPDQRQRQRVQRVGGGGRGGVECGKRAVSIAGRCQTPRF